MENVTSKYDYKVMLKPTFSPLQHLVYRPNRRPCINENSATIRQRQGIEGCHKNGSASHHAKMQYLSERNAYLLMHVARQRLNAGRKTGWISDDCSVGHPIYLPALHKEWNFLVYHHLTHEQMLG
jgi:hypothetical protein